MFNTQQKITLASQLLDSIDNHLQIIHLPIEQYQMSIEDSDDDDLWLSGHRSIFSSYDSHNENQSSVLPQSQYDEFQWDFYENQNYHHLTFEHDDQQKASLSEWSMNFSSNSTNQQPVRTSWQEIKTKSLSSSTNTSTNDSYTCNTLPLYHLFQQKKSSSSRQQHPCRLYENFSDQSQCKSSIYTEKSKVDQCLQTSLNEPCSKNTHHLSSNPSQLSSSTTRHSLPNLDFLTYYANENPATLTRQSKHICTAMKSPLFDPLARTKKGLRTIFYFTMQTPNTKDNKREEPETVSSVCSSTSSSGYCSNSSRHTHTPLSSHPLKSCLKRTKDTCSIDESSKHRRYSAPTSSSPSSSSQNKSKLCTLSEHDLRAKKSVSFCNEIARRLITPSSSPKTRCHNTLDLIPQESFTDSPPSEFNLSDNEQDNDYDNHIINMIENSSENLPKTLLMKYTNDQHLIDTFAQTILRIFEIKCSDPKSYYLNNQTNLELDRILRQDLCTLIREILEDGLRQTTNSLLFSKKIHLWRLIDSITPSTGRLNEIKIKSQLGLPSTADPIDKFNSFIYQLLNFHELTTWLTDFLSHRTLLMTYYESWAFLIVNFESNLFENLTNQLEKLSPLSFRLKYTITNSNSRHSILSKKFQVRTWLRDKKPQVKQSSTTTTTVPPNVTIRRKFNTSIPKNQNQHAF